MAYNDLADITRIKYPVSEEAVFSWEISSDTPAETEKKLKISSGMHIYKFFADSKTYYKDEKAADMPCNIYLRENIFMLPVRTLAKILEDNAAVSWDNDNKTAKITFGNKNFEFILNGSLLKVGNETFAFPDPMEIKNDRMYIPVTALPIIQYFNTGEKTDAAYIYYTEKDDILHIRM